MSNFTYGYNPDNNISIYTLEVSVNTTITKEIMKFVDMIQFHDHLLTNKEIDENVFGSICSFSYNNIFNLMGLKGYKQSPGYETHKSFYIRYIVNMNAYKSLSIHEINILKDAIGYNLSYVERNFSTKRLDDTVTIDATCRF